MKIRRTVIAGLLVLGAGGAAWSQGKEIPVGVFNATTGAYAFGGVPIQNAMKLALEEANQKGLPGGAKFKVHEGDTAGEKGQVINLVNQFAKRDKVMLILGPTTSLEALAGAPVANDLQVPMLAIGSSNDILATGPWAFKVQAFGTDIMGFLGKLAVEKLGVKKLLLVHDKGNEGYITQTRALRDYVTANGVQIVGEEQILSSDTNFLALATKIANIQTDAVFMAAPAELAANFFIQLRQAGVDPKVKFIGPSTFASQGFIKTGGKAVEGTFLVSDYAPTNPSALNASFVSAYKARYGAVPDNWAAMGYTIGQLAVQAVQNAGPNPDRERLRVELGKLNRVPVVIGNGTWSVNTARQPSYGGVLLTVKDGAFLPVQ
jgi:branched-chain amino acid transport system substrate-binding protein